jgi:aminopeptidase-like protein
MSEEMVNILEEINKNIKLIILANRAQIEKEKKTFLDSGDNLKILNLCNGRTQIKDIAQKVKKTRQAIQYVVDQLNLYGFVSLLNAPSGKAKLPKKM